MSINDSFAPGPANGWNLDVQPPDVTVRLGSLFKYSILGDDLGSAARGHGRPEQALLLEWAELAGYEAFDYQDPNQILATRDQSGSVTADSWNSDIVSGVAMIPSIQMEPPRYRGM